MQRTVPAPTTQFSGSIADSENRITSLVGSGHAIFAILKSRRRGGAQSSGPPKRYGMVAAELGKDGVRSLNQLRPRAKRNWAVAVESASGRRGAKNILLHFRLDCAHAGGRGRVYLSVATPGRCTSRPLCKFRVVGIFGPTDPAAQRGHLARLQSYFATPSASRTTPGFREPEKRPAGDFHGKK